MSLPTGPPSSPPRRAPPPVVRWILGLVGIAIAIPALAVALLQSPTAVRWAAESALEAARPLPGTVIHVGGASGGIVRGIELHDVRLSSGAGVTQAHLDTLRVRWLPSELFGRPLRVREIRAAGLTFLTTPAFDSLAAWLSRRPPSRGSGGGLRVDRIELSRGTIEIARSDTAATSTAPSALAGTRASRLEAVLDSLDASGGALSLGHASLTGELFARDQHDALGRLEARARIERGRVRDLDLRIDGPRSHARLAGELDLPGGGRTSLRGADLTLHLAPLAGADFERLVPRLERAPDLMLEAHLNGTADSIAGEARASSEDGAQLEARGALTSPKTGGASLALWARASGVDLASWSATRPGERVLSGKLDGRLSGSDLAHLDGPFDLALEATGTGSRARPIRASLSARFTNGDASVRADAALNRFTLHVAGTARPIGARVGCDLDVAAGLPAIPPPGATSARARTPLLAGRVIGTLRAERDSEATASGVAALEFEPDPAAGSLLGSGRLDATLAGRRIEWTTRFALGRGSVAAEGAWLMEPVPRLTIRTGEARQVPLGALLGDSLASTLDARFALEARGLPSAAARADAWIAPLIVRRGLHVARLDTLRLALHDGRLDAHLGGSFDDAAVQGDAWLRPAVAPARAAGFSLRFQGIDGARIFSDTLYTSRLDGTAEGRIDAPDLAEWLSPATLTRARAAQADGAASITLFPSEWRHGRIRSLTVRTSLSGGMVRSQGEIDATFGRVGWSAEAEPFGAEREARLTSLTLEGVDLSGLVAALPATRLGGRLSGEGSGASFDSLDARWGAVLDGSNVGTNRFARLRLSGNLVHGALDARIEADDGPDSVLAQVAGRLRRAARGALAATGHLEAGARFGGASLDTVSGEFAIEPGMLRVRRLEISGNLAQVSAFGQVAFPGGSPGDSTSFEAHGRIRDLAPLGNRLGFAPLAAGSGSFELGARGPRRALDLSGHLSATRLRAGSSRADSLEIRVRALASGDSITGGSGHLYVHGLVPMGLQERSLEADARWDGRELGISATAHLAVGGSQAATVRIEPAPGLTRVSLDGFEMHGRRTDIRLEHAASAEFGGGIAVDDLVLLQDGRRCLMVSGAVRDDPASVLSVTVDSLDVGAPAAWLGWPDLRGRVSGSATVRGPRRDPAVDGTLRGTLAPIQGRWARLDGRLAWGRDSLVAALGFHQSDRQGATLGLRLPVGLDLDPPPGKPFISGYDGKLDAHLEAHAFDFAWFEPLISQRLVRRLEGRMEGDALVRGTPSAPVLAGELHITRARAQIPRLGTTFESRDIGLRFHERTVTLGPSTVSAGGGRVELGGNASFEGAGHRVFETRLRFDRFRFMNTALARLEMNGDLEAHGAPLSPSVTGTLTVANSTLYAESGSSDRKLESVELTEDDWRELEARFSDADVSVAPPLARLSDSLRADVTLKIGQNVWVRRRSDPIVALELSGQVRATREAGEPLQLAGRIDVETGRSYLSFLNRRFDLTRANVELPGPVHDATAELEAQYLPGSNGGSGADGPEVTALVTLDASGARVDLRSTPYMEHAALVNYLATGQTQGEMASGTAYGLAVGTVLGSVGGSAGRSLGLDVVQVTQDAYGGQTLVAGSHVKPQLYLGFRQPVVEGQQTSSRGETSTYTTEFEVEVAAGRQMLLNLQGGGSQYRFLLRPRLGK